MNYCIKLELLPTTEESKILDSQSKILNWTYNHLLAHAKALNEEYLELKKQENNKNNDQKEHQDQRRKEIPKELFGRYGLRNKLPDLKKEHAFLKSVHSSPLKNAVLRLNDSLKAYLDSRTGKRKGLKTGFPRFRAYKRKWFSLFYDEPKKGFKISGKTLQLSLGVEVIGEDKKQQKNRVHLSLKLKDSINKFCKKGSDLNIKNIRITKELNRYFAVVCVEEPSRQAELSELKKEDLKIISIDPNHKNFGYGVDTNGKSIEIKNPSFLKARERRIDELKKKRDQCNRKANKKEIGDIGNK